MQRAAEKPDDRFTSADSLRTALKQYLQPVTQPSEDAATAQSTLKLRPHPAQERFSALSQAISAINKIANADAESLHVLSSTILGTFPDQQAAAPGEFRPPYSQLAATINTISRAVVILGFDTIRNLAIHFDPVRAFAEQESGRLCASSADEIILAFSAG